MTNKKKTLLLSAFLLSLFLSACGDVKEEDWDARNGSAESASANSASQNSAESELVPDLAQVRAIASLSSLKCVYHNVAYGTQEAGSGISHIGEKPRNFMQEYDCEVEISYNVKNIVMTQNGSEIRIRLPEPDISSRKIPESIDRYSYVEEPDQWIQQNPITADTINEAVNEADRQMEEDIRNNSSLLATAEGQAKQLIENYIHQIGNLTNVEYTIIWETE